MDRLFVTILGLLAVAGIAWFFWGPRRGGVRASAVAGGYQEANITVHGGYVPDTVVVQPGRPVRLHFLRTESAPCSDTVVFGDFGKSAKLPQGEEVTVELPPSRPGTFEFTCAMGMLRGRLVVEQS